MKPIEMGPPVMRNQNYARQWVAFYMMQGYTEPQSEVLARQLCSDGRRDERATVDDKYGFKKTGKYCRRQSPARNVVTIDEIKRAMADYA